MAATKTAPTPGAAGVAAPQDGEFDGSEAFIHSSQLEGLARTLINRHTAHLNHLHSKRLSCLWKKAGGQAKGKPRLGSTLRPGALLGHYSEVDLIIWLAADHAREAELGPEQIEALLFHHLCRTSADEKTGELLIIGPDAEVFGAELEAYGLWRLELREIAPAFQQLPLAAVADELDDRGDAGASENGHADA